MLKFYLEKMSSPYIMFLVESYISLVQMIPARQRAKRKAGRKMRKDSQPSVMKKGNNLIANQFTFQRQHKGKMLCAKRKLVSKVYAFYKEPS